MCGIVGVAGEIAFKDEKTLAQLLVVDSLRGVDSTGVAVVSRFNDVKIAKQVGNPYELIDTHTFNNAFKGAHKVIIGHNRYGTQGKINRRNAHPFEFDNVVGVHNGTIVNKWQLREGNAFDVDSEAIYNSISKYGLDATIKDMRGAWTLVWWDKETEELKILRNEERPLFITKTLDDKLMFWASEAWMLEGVLSRNGYNIGQIVAVEKDMLHSFPINNQGKIEKVHIRKAEGQPTPKYTGGGTSTSTSNVSQIPVKHPQQQQQVQRPTLHVTSKKDGVVPITAAHPKLTDDLASSYESSQEVLLEIKEIRRDCSGNRYFLCYDPDYPSYVIRYYFNRLKEPESYIEEIFQADIGSYLMDDIGIHYFKVNASSVKFLEDDEPVETVASSLAYPNKDGELLNYNDWISKYGSCTWCSTAILPTDDWSISTEDQPFCGDCTGDPEVGRYLKIACKH